MDERTTYCDKGELDEVVAGGGVHIERMDKNYWFILCQRKDGTEVALWVRGKITLMEEREPRPTPPA